MISPEPLLKTQQVADALGVSVSTVKRWVDAGEIRASRTVGRHRMIPLSEAERFARERNYPAQFAAPRGVATPAAPAAGVDEPLCEELEAALTAGREAEVSRLIRAAYADAGAVVLGDDLIRPVMERVGHRWQFGVLDIYQEHRATHLVESALRALCLQAGPRAGASAPLALGAATEDDPYTLSNLLIELTLRDQGWHVMNLGPNLPLSSLGVAVKQNRPRLVWLSVNHLADPAQFLQDYREFFSTATRTGAAVILGGQALGAELRARLLATGFGDRVAHLAEFARRFHPNNHPASAGP